jgi:Zn-dependent protease
VRGSLTLGKIFGIPIKLHISWFLVAALVTWSLAGGFFPRSYPGWSGATYWIVGAVTALLFFASVLLHELGHSLVALREKVPVKGITLFIFGGVAQIGDEPPTPGAEFRIAIAGPLTSLLLAALSALLRAGFSGTAVLAAPLAYVARINLMLAFFNLIPGFPLDGGRVLRSAIWGLGGSFRTATRWATAVGRGVAYLFILFGLGQMFLGGFVNGLWTVFIGWFLKDAASASYQQAILREKLTGVTLRDLAPQRCVAVPADLPVVQLTAQYVLGAGQQCFFVMDGGGVRGTIGLSNLRAVPPEQRDQLTAGQIMTPVERLFRAQADEELLTLLRRMEEANAHEVSVEENGRLLGLISRGNLLNYLRLRTELSV